MKTYKFELKRRIRQLMFFALFAPIIILVMTVFSTLQGGEPVHIGSIPWERMAGFFVGIEVVSILRIRYYRKAMKSKESLEELQVMETDERNQLIQRKTCETSLLFGVILLGYGAIISSFFSETVFYTFAGILMGFIILYLVVLVYFKNRM